MVLIDLQPSSLLVGLINYLSPLVNKNMVLGFIMMIVTGLWRWKIVIDLLFSKLIIFMDKIILEKSRTEKYSKSSENSKKILRDIMEYEELK